MSAGRISRGSALLLTLWCVAVLSLSILAVARMVSRDVDVAGMENRRFEARQLALTGIAYGSQPRIERWDPLLDQKFPDGSELRVREYSESARLDINRLLKEPQQPALRKLFDVWGVPPEAISVAIDSMVDWTDRDDLHLANGAERPELAGQQVYSIPANRDFHSVDEMERVRGMDVVAQYKPDWRDFFTVYGGRRVDLQDASLDVMQAGGIPLEVAAQIDEIRRGADREPQTRDDFKIKDVAAFFQQMGFAGPQAELALRRFAPGSEPTRVVSTAIVGGTSYRISVVMNRSTGGAASMISWEEQ